MKVIAHTGGGLLVEITEAEIAAAMGFENHWTEAWKRATAIQRQRGSDSAQIRVGAEFKVEALHAHLRAVLAHEAKAKEAAAVLRALAGLIDKGLPSSMEPPTQAPDGPVFHPATPPAT